MRPKGEIIVDGWPARPEAMEGVLMVNTRSGEIFRIESVTPNTATVLRYTRFEQFRMRVGLWFRRLKRKLLIFSVR